MPGMLRSRMSNQRCAASARLARSSPRTMRSDLSAQSGAGMISAAGSAKSAATWARRPSRSPISKAVCTSSARASSVPAIFSAARIRARPFISGSERANAAAPSRSCGVKLAESRMSPSKGMGSAPARRAFSAAPTRITLEVSAELAASKPEGSPRPVPIWAVIGNLSRAIITT